MSEAIRAPSPLMGEGRGEGERGSQSPLTLTLSRMGRGEVPCGKAGLRVVVNRGNGRYFQAGAEVAMVCQYAAGESLPGGYRALVF